MNRKGRIAITEEDGEITKIETLEEINGNWIPSKTHKLSRIVGNLREYRNPDDPSDVFHFDKTKSAPDYVPGAIP